MPEDIMARLNRLANAGRKPKPEVKQETKREFTMPNREPEPPARGKGYLCKLMDEIDKKYNNGVIR